MREELADRAEGLDEFAALLQPNGARRRLRIAIAMLGLVALGLAIAVWVANDGIATSAAEGFLFAVPLGILGACLVVAAHFRGTNAAETRRSAHLVVLQAAAQRMSRSLTVAGVGRAIVEETRRIIDYHNARVYLLEPPDDLIPIAFEGRVGAYERVDLDLLRSKLGLGFTGWVALHNAPLRIDDANADPRGETIPGTDDVDESMLVVPLRHDGAVVGVITLSKLGLRQFDDEDLRLLTILADQAATALTSARLLGQTQELAAELRRLLDMSGALSASLDPRAVANLIGEHLARSVGAEEAVVSYWDRANDRLLTLGYFPTARIGEVDAVYSLGGYPTTRRVLTEQVEATIDADDPEADPAEVALLRQQGMRGVVMLPLVAKGESIGLVELLGRQRVAVDPTKRALARTMANEAAMALENARLYENARNLADRDPLTGFYNHRYLHERLGEEVVRARRTNRPLSVLMLDLDEFKLVNDTFGHLFGDRVLVHVAERVRSTLRGSDVAARYGGDEFAVILPDTDASAARNVAERIVRMLADTPFRADGRTPVPVLASIGVATHPDDGRTATDLIAAADRALFRSKDVGGAAVHSTRDEPDARPELVVMAGNSLDLTVPMIRTRHARRIAGPS
ncbi:MAG: diguanylate cyclase [Chloroflexota bacterium]